MKTFRLLVLCSALLAVAAEVQTADIDEKDNRQADFDYFYLIRWDASRTMASSLVSYHRLYVPKSSSSVAGNGRQHSATSTLAHIAPQGGRHSVSKYNLRMTRRTFFRVETTYSRASHFNRHAYMNT